MIETYLSWTRNPSYKCSTIRLAQQATLVLAFIENCRASGVANLIYQGSHETKNYPVVVRLSFFLSFVLKYSYFNNLFQ